MCSIERTIGRNLKNKDYGPKLERTYEKRINGCIYSWNNWTDYNDYLTLKDKK